MTVTDEELKAWVASKRPLLDQREYPQPAAWGLGRRTESPDAVCGILDGKFYPSAVNVGDENELTLAIIDSVLRSQGHSGIHGGTQTIIMTSIVINAVLSEYPSSLVQSASPTKHGNVWALTMMLKLSELDSDGSLMDRKRKPMIHISGDLMEPPSTVEEVYLRLTAQSLCKTMPLETSAVRPNEAFGLLTNSVWTLGGVFTLNEYDTVEALGEADMGIDVQVPHQDKLPRLIDYLRPTGVRIADGNRVRLGARLAPGTTMMHEGFANFNAVTLGPCMIEGRLSAGVTIGANSDVGGGVSTLGTMSGGNNTRVSVGELCLLEAECILGIPIGDRVRVEAGLPLKSTTPIQVAGNPDEWRRGVHDMIGQEVLPKFAESGEWVKGVDLAGINDAIFRRNARTGAMEVVPRGNHEWGGLNFDLHNN